MVGARVAIVTGGGRGLGRAHCLRLGADGATVVVSDIGAGLHGESEDAGPADEVVAAIRSAGGVAVPDGTSVSDWTGTEQLMKRTVEELGRLDIVVNNASPDAVRGGRHGCEMISQLDII